MSNKFIAICIILILIPTFLTIVQLGTFFIMSLLGYEMQESYSKLGLYTLMGSFGVTLVFIILFLLISYIKLNIDKYYKRTRFYNSIV
jgi:hypothetical protein